jgi:hypothetical protein
MVAIVPSPGVPAFGGSGARLPVELKRPAIVTAPQLRRKLDAAFARRLVVAPSALAYAPKDTCDRRGGRCAAAQPTL